MMMHMHIAKSLKMLIMISSMPPDLHLDSDMIINVMLCNWPSSLCPLHSSVNNM